MVEIHAGQLGEHATIKSWIKTEMAPSESFTRVSNFFSTIRLLRRNLTDGIKEISASQVVLGQLQADGLGQPAATGHHSLRSDIWG